MIPILFTVFVLLLGFAMLLRAVRLRKIEKGDKECFDRECAGERLTSEERRRANRELARIRKRIAKHYSFVIAEPPTKKG